MTGNERLKLLSQHLRNLPGKRRFDMSRWAVIEQSAIDPNARLPLNHVTGGVLPTGNFDCGAAACAFGEACLIPELQAEGLRLATDMLVVDDEDEGVGMYPVFEGQHSFKAAAKFFEINHIDAIGFFDPACYDTDPEISATEVADRIDRYLKTQ